MMPDLGNYTVYVLAAYGVSLGLIGGLIWWAVLRARAARHRLDRIESELK